MAGASNPPDPPKPTDNTLVNTGANIHVRFMRPRRVEMAWSVEGIPGPGWSPPKTPQTKIGFRPPQNWPKNGQKNPTENAKTHNKISQNKNNSIHSFHQSVVVSNPLKYFKHCLSKQQNTFSIVVVLPSKYI